MKRPTRATEKTRVWIPTSTTRPTNVICWAWTARSGLWAFLAEEMAWPSEYGTLYSFLRAVADRREGPVRELEPGEFVPTTLPR